MVIISVFTVWFVITLLAAVVFGWWFARYTTYQEPPPEGFTYLYVIIGVGMTVIFGIIGQALAALSGFNAVIILLIPGFMFCITGGFMTGYQERNRQELSKNTDDTLHQINENYYKKRVI